MPYPSHGPDTPVNVNASPGDKRVTLTWTAVEGATSYVVYYGTQTGVSPDNYEFTEVKSPSAGGYIITGLENSVTYYFVITAKIGTDESGPSGEAHATSQLQTGDDIITIADLDMTFKRIPAGTKFQMGRPVDGELGSDSDEDDQHEVVIADAYYIMTTEVTQAQWQAVMDNNPSIFQDCGGIVR